MAENQLLDASNDPRLQIGGNFPPLAEQLDEGVKALAERGQELLALAAAAVIIDYESAQKVINLSQILRGFEEEVDAARVAMAAPYIEAERMINARFGAVMAPVARARLGDKSVGDGLKGMVDAYETKRKADEAAATARRLAEQQQREAEAEAARAAVEAKRLAGTATAADTLEVMRAEEEATAAAVRATAIRAEPLRATLGQLGTTRAVAFDIESLPKLLGWMIKQPIRNTLQAEVRKLMGTYLRSLGVNAVANGVTIPGVKAWVTENTHIRR